MSVEVFCRYDAQRIEYEMVVRVTMPNGGLAYMHPPTFTTAPDEASRRVPEGMIWREPNLDLVNGFAQVAWDQGWRPKGFGTEDVNTMKAHLEDKRDEVRWLRELYSGPRSA